MHHLFGLFGLGALLSGAGDVEGARAAYQRAVDTSDSELAPYAALNLGSMLAEHGDVEGARAAYQRAIDSGGPELSPLASLNLGILLARHSDIEGARAALEVAIHSDQRQASQWGSYYLVLRATQGALAAAKGAGYVVGHPVGRWCREALFFLVWSCPQGVMAAALCELAGLESD